MHPGTVALILLDTHAWVWWLNRDRKLKATARKQITEAQAVGISPISIFEICNAVRRDRLRLAIPLDRWLTLAVGSGVVILPIEPSIAALAGSIEWAHGDPADRILVATALHHGIPLLTADKQIRNSGLVEVVW